jgi:hypothetical protein
METKILGMTMALRLVAMVQMWSIGLDVGSTNYDALRRYFAMGNYWLEVFYAFHQEHATTTMPGFRYGPDGDRTRYERVSRQSIGWKHRFPLDRPTGAPDREG